MCKRLVKVVESIVMLCTITIAISEEDVPLGELHLGPIIPKVFLAVGAAVVIAMVAYAHLDEVLHVQVVFDLVMWQMLWLN